MNSEKLINPYALLGIKPSCSISQLKKNYYHLSLLTHPDKGGSATDFHIVHLAYHYIKKQIQDLKDVSYEELEEEFLNFCANQENTKPPTFYGVYEETNDWLVDFNSKFEADKKEELEENFGETYQIFQRGYGDLMEKSEIGLEYEELEKENLTQPFSQELVEYEEPSFLPDTITYFPIDNPEIDDYGDLSGNLKSADYKMTHSQKKNLSEEIKKIGLPEFTDYPREKLEYSPNFI